MLGFPLAGVRRDMTASANELTKGNSMSELLGDQVGLGADQTKGPVKRRKPWRAPEVISSMDQIETAKSSDTLPEGHATGTTPIS